MSHRQECWRASDAPPPLQFRQIQLRTPGVYAGGYVPAGLVSEKGEHGSRATEIVSIGKNRTLRLLGMLIRIEKILGDFLYIFLSWIFHF